MAEKQDQATLIAMRNKLNLTQTKFAHLLGMSLGAYQKIENGVSDYRLIHRLAAERITLTVAAQNDDYGLISNTVMNDIRKIYGGQLPDTKGAKVRDFFTACEVLKETFAIIADGNYYITDVWVPTYEYATFETLTKLVRNIYDPGITSWRLVPATAALYQQYKLNPNDVSAEEMSEAIADVETVLAEISNHPDELVSSAPEKARKLFMF